MKIDLTAECFPQLIATSGPTSLIVLVSKQPGDPPMLLGFKPTVVEDVVAFEENYLRLTYELTPQADHGEVREELQGFILFENADDTMEVGYVVEVSEDTRGSMVFIIGDAADEEIEAPFFQVILRAAP